MSVLVLITKNICDDSILKASTICKNNTTVIDVANNIYKLAYMIYGKEKVKLKTILSSVSGIDTYEEKQMEILNESYREYSAIINLLHKKHPNVFANQYKHDLQEIKDNKMFTKKSFSEEARQKNFVIYKDSVIQAIQSTIEYIDNYVQ